MHGVNEYEHHEHLCDRDHGEDYSGGCAYCDGSLFLCDTCGCSEGATTTNCPGVWLTRQQIDDIYAGKLDFVDGKRVNQASGSCATHYKKQGNDKCQS